MTFGERLRHLRERKEWSQGQLGIKVKVDGETVHRWEHGICRPTWERLFKLCDIFDCSLDYLMGRR